MSNWRYHTFTCPACKKPFAMTGAEYNNAHHVGDIKLCSKYCAREYRKATRLKIVYSCKYCGKEVVAFKHGVHPKFCSPQCSQDHYHPEITCLKCGIKFRTKVMSKHKTHKYCSSRCACDAAHIQSVQIKARKKSEAKGLHFVTVVKHLRAEGRFDKCDDCGYIECKEIIEPHHIDFNRLNNLEWNIASLCPNCHAKRHLFNGKVVNDYYRLIALEKV